MSVQLHRIPRRRPRSCCRDCYHWATSCDSSCTFEVGYRSDSHRAAVAARFWMAAPLLTAILYPFTLEAFNLSVTRIVQRSGGTVALSWFGAVACLALAFAVPLLATVAAMSLAEIDRQTVAQLRAKRAALLAVTAPTLLVFIGVVLTMLHNPVPDTWLWVVGWAIGLVGLLRSDNNEPATPAVRPVPAPLRVAHGVSALAIVLIFLALHLTNHLIFPTGPAAYEAVQKVFRHVYRSNILQPLLVALMLFQVGTGLFFVWRLTAAPSDRFRTFQILSGVYLAVYVLGHMDSVFIFARTYLGIDTGWNFATGDPAGMIKHPWNIRLLPHYWLAVFFVLSHLASGARVIMMAHGVGKAFADRFLVAGTVAAGFVATWIMLGMSGMRIQFV
jgi:hypothetical protein